MALTKQQLAENIRSLGINPGDSVVVHSSYKAIGEVAGGPAAVIESLQEVILPRGALLFPNLYIPHEFTVNNPPRFDLKKDSIRILGIIPEIFKFQYARHFSLHPTHSMMGIGERAPEILSGHELAGCPCGRGTPWHKNALADGKILFIGAQLKSNTTYHTAEEMLENTFKLSREVIYGEVILDGRAIVVPSRLHLWGVSPAGVKVDLNGFNRKLESCDCFRRGKIGNADTICLQAKGYLKLAFDWLNNLVSAGKQTGISSAN